MSDELKAKTISIVERTIAYSVRIVRLYQELEKTGAGRVLGRQLLRSGTSVGANVHEAQGAQTRLDFIAKIYVACKDAILAAILLTAKQRLKNKQATHHS